MPVNIDIETKTEVLLEALPYIQQFRGSIFVVKFGGSFMDTEQARVGVATDLVFLATVGIHVVVVHGGGPAINRAMADEAIEPIWKNGLRYTDAKTIRIVERTLNEVINLGICENIELRKGHPVGVKGQELFRCRRLDRDPDGQPIDLGFVGSVTAVETKTLRDQLDQGHMPIISPVGRDGDGQLYNINADTAASHLASAIGARRLVYLCDVPGLLQDPKNPDSLISSVSEAEMPRLRNEGVIGSGMLPKVESAINALGSGVHRVHLIDGRLPHSILLEIFTDKGVGTEIVHAS
jgi:acetylglutamate kinase